MKFTEYHKGGYISGTPAFNRSIELDLNSGLFTSWDTSGNQLNQRSLTSTEQDMLNAQVTASTEVNNQITLQSRMQSALTTNNAFLSLSSPTNLQVIAQVQRITKECNALIRLALLQVADITDTV